MWARTGMLVATIVVGCGAPAPSAGDAVSCERQGFANESAPAPELDLAIVVSDAPSMAAHRDALVANLATLGAALGSAGGAMPSLHLAVIADDSGGFARGPFVPGCAPPTGPVLTDLDRPWFLCPGDPDGCRDRDYTGDLPDVVACLAAAPATGAGPAPLLARLEAALGPDDPDAAAFLRPGAVLAVLVIGDADDASSGDAAGFAARLLTTRADPASVYVAVVAGAATPRLDAFAAAFGDHRARVSIDAADWSDAFAFLGPLQIQVPSNEACLWDADLTDVDPDAPGLQLDCVATDLGALVPPCRMATPELPAADTPLPCVWFAPPYPGDPYCDARPTFERARHEGRYGELRCACTP